MPTRSCNVRAETTPISNPSSDSEPITKSGDVSRRSSIARRPPIPPIKRPAIAPAPAPTITHQAIDPASSRSDLGASAPMSGGIPSSRMPCERARTGDAESSGGRATAVLAPRRRQRASSAASWAVSVGVVPTLIPFASRAFFFPSAVPEEPEMIAPAWPIVLPGGAVNPAM